MSTITRTPRSCAAAAARIEEAASQSMWVYYRDHKAQLISHVRECRETILADLIAGVPVETAFAPHVKPSEYAKSLRRAA